MATYKEFAAALAADEGLQARFNELAKELDPKDKGEALEAQREIAAKLGFDVPGFEFREAATVAQQLSDEDLDFAAGGCFAIITDNGRII